MADDPADNPRDDRDPIERLDLVTNWANDDHNFWGRLNCDGLFLLFDTSAHVNNGVPDVDSDAVLVAGQR